MGARGVIQAAPDTERVIQTEKIGQIAQPRMNGAGRFARVQAVDRHPSRIGRFQRRHAAQKRGLSRTVGPDQGGYRPPLHRQGDPVQGPMTGIFEDKVLYTDHWVIVTFRTKRASWPSVPYAKYLEFIRLSRQNTSHSQGFSCASR